MSFEEQFPSLKGIDTTGDNYGYHRAFGIIDIEKHCLDKAKVSEALVAQEQESKCRLNVFRERLGL